MLNSTGDLKAQNFHQKTLLETPNGGDPSAGSPTETLLRLLLPLDDTV